MNEPREELVEAVAGQGRAESAESEHSQDHAVGYPGAKHPPKSVQVNGGEGGGYLRRSELRTLRREANRYPMAKDERREVVTTVLDVMRAAESSRTRLAAAKTVLALDDHNLESLKVAVAHQQGGKAGAGAVNVQVNVDQRDTRLAELMAAAEERRRLAEGK